MGRYRRRFKKKQKKQMQNGFLRGFLGLGLAIGALVFLPTFLMSVLPLFPTEFYYGLFATLVVGGFLAVAFQSKVEPDTYINQNGYVVLRRQKELEHRSVAKRVLGRSLEPNEIVHHINGIKIDNSVKNLCVMDREKHEHFHAWLRWKKGKGRFYPSFGVQKRALVNEYNGILLEDVPPREPSPTPDPVRQPGAKVTKTVKIETYIVRRNKTTKKPFVEFDEEILISPEGRDIESDEERFGEPEEVFKSELTAKQLEVLRNKQRSRQYSEANRKSESDQKRRLFNELRKVRGKLAKEHRLPPYMIFYNETLIEMCELLPESEAMMLQVRGVGPHKYQRYGEPFLEAIKKFKREHSKPQVS